MEDDLDRICREIEALPYVHRVRRGLPARFPVGAPRHDLIARLEIPPALEPVVAILASERDYLPDDRGPGDE